MGLEKRIDRTRALFDERHWDLFEEFVKLEMASGGPDPHVAFVGALACDCSIEEKLWRGFCYISAYNVASAEIIWRDWPWPRILEESMLPWLYENWAGITTRTERKSVRIKENMGKFFDDSADWICAVLNGDKNYLIDNSISATERYDILWDDVIDNVKYLGRYVAIKLLEYFRRYCNFDIAMYDVRPIDGWSPRMTLSLLFPDYIEYMLSTDSQKNMKMIQRLSDETLERLRTNVGLVQADMFILECVLCNYRQSYVGKKLYPGRTHDTEHKYMHKILRHWESMDKPGLEFFNVRKKIFPTEHLIECNAYWSDRFDDGVRSKDLGVLTRSGFIWSDLLYDYNATVSAGRAFDDPIERNFGEQRLLHAFDLRKKALSC